MADQTLSDEEFWLILDKKSISKDYFYVLSIALKDSEDSYLMFVVETRNGIASCNNIAYASKVARGDTLTEAIKADLKDDFNYDGGFFIEVVKPYDQTTNRKGDYLTRLLVYIRLDEQFNTDGLNTLNMNPHWHDNSGHQVTAEN